MGSTFWVSGYGVWSTGNIKDEMLNEYLEHHRRDSRIIPISYWNRMWDFQSRVKETSALLVQSGLVIRLKNMSKIKTIPLIIRQL